MDISSILGSLSPEEIDGLRKTAETILSPGKSGGEGPSVPIPGLDAGLLEQISRVSDAFSKDDDRTRLIHAIKPFLGEVRKTRADEAVSFLRMMNALALLQEGGDKRAG